MQLWPTPSSQPSPGAKALTPPPSHRPYVIQHAVPEAYQPRYAAAFRRPSLSQECAAIRLGAQLVGHWQRGQSPASDDVCMRAHPVLQRPLSPEPDPHGLLALRRAYSASLLSHGDTACAVESDDE